MLHPKFIIPVLLFVFSAAHCMAQDMNTDSIVKVMLAKADSQARAAADSQARVAADTVTTNTTTADTTVVEQTSTPLVTDTVLIVNNLSVSKDSMALIKKMEGFEYAKNLDSLLRDLQKQQAAKREEPPKSNWLLEMLASKITMYVFWGLAVCFILIILYNLFLTQGIFVRRSAASKPTVDLIKEEVLTASDYNKLISEATINANYRLGVRYLYLQCLQLLSAKGLITLASDKTNYQYVQELYGKKYRNEFATLTLNYEYIWYGEFEIDEAAFLRISNNFKQFNNQL